MTMAAIDPVTVLVMGNAVLSLFDHIIKTDKSGNVPEHLIEQATALRKQLQAASASKPA
jgi:hypothetical protein